MVDVVDTLATMNNALKFIAPLLPSYFSGIYHDSSIEIPIRQQPQSTSEITDDQNSDTAGYVSDSTVHTVKPAIGPSIQAIYETVLAAVSTISDRRNDTKLS